MKKRFKKNYEPHAKGSLFIISAPSGAGKTTLCQEIIKNVPGLTHSISYTTRQPRKGERKDVHYSFISQSKFKEMIKKDEFAEWAMVHGNFYGTSIKRLEKLKKEGYDIILDIDTQGAMQMRRKFKDAVYIFIIPPSMKILRKRLADRMSESKYEIVKRLEKAKDEIANYKNYDYIIINNKFKKALQELKCIILTTRLSTTRANHKWIKKTH